MVPRMGIMSSVVESSHGVGLGGDWERELGYMRSRGIGEVEGRELLRRGYMVRVMDLVGEECVKKEIFDSYLLRYGTFLHLFDH